MCINVLLATLLLLFAVHADPSVSDTASPQPNATGEGSTRIVGGTNAQVGQFPYQASLRFNGRHLCGGAIISQNYIVTAAHCVSTGKRVTPASSLTIRVGSTQRTTSDPNAVVANIAEVKVHPSYNNFGYDVALLRLANPLEFNTRIAAIPLASVDPPSNTEALVAGFGQISAGGPLSPQLLFTRLTVITSARCRRFTPSVSNTVICLLHNSGTGACYGDSGGPAISNGELIGVASFVLGTCARRAPDGYTRVSVLRNWLINNSDL